MTTLLYILFHIGDNAPIYYQFFLRGKNIETETENFINFKTGYL